ncbi:helix-turn-helix domain-containing protein [Draconibacterium sp. IB214405]|uniref:helix-turn-helix domain-containing protein n=1 Tax=Draconibacterium sp. IB214405 TaxID=3097352 RepID=UPI002A16BD37|nr:helix-turn-helix domain-containing protein [Draconibacterium sp. IB214405]MDX8339117.1 helix-turn-helix domain-containing protein [Draconibacterium sp. IB214405]
MPNLNTAEKNFLNQITQLVEENISNEQFGVSELADAVGMSRSNLLRKIKKITDLSASQFIRNVRLKYAVELLQEGSDTVSEVSYKVGFGSPSYFIKCFRELYGYPPGEIGNQEEPEEEQEQEIETEQDLKAPMQKKKFPVLLISIFFITICAVVLFFVLRPDTQNSNKVKSIAVLPFLNDSNDTSNVYIINGLMEATLNNLQQIQDLRVISRTSVEQYRNNPKSSPEIARELNATYLIEGSGQKIGDQILLNIQLIEAETDKHLWSQQYRRETKDIFTLQADVAKNIAEQIEAIVTPEETQRIEKKPTSNLAAYDLFLKGLDLHRNPTDENLLESISYFKKAIQQDNEFARAYAGVAISFYFLDRGRTVKQYADSINYYADQALFFDAKLPQSLTAKALFYIEHNEYELALPYLEKALEISPNSDVVLIFLVEIYVNYLPNTEKYLEYALKGLEIKNVAAYDSAAKSISYLHLSNAFIQSGFINEAEKYINISLSYQPENLYSQYVKAFIQYAKNQDMNELNKALLAIFEKDKTRLDVLQEVAKSYYYLRDFETAAIYYKAFVDVREQYNLNINQSENGKIAVTFDITGQKELSEKYFDQYRLYAENDPSIYSNISLAFYYSYQGDTDKAIEYLEAFSLEDNFTYWTILFTPIEPLTDNLREHPQYKKVFHEIENKFDAYHKRIEKSLQGKGLL